MGNIIQFPRPNPQRRWSPSEILAIEIPENDRLRQSRERSRIATSQKIASGAGKRENRRAERKQAIVSILSDGQQWTVARLMRTIEYRSDQPISRTTVTSLLQELKGEGRALNINQFWKSTDSQRH
jgi:hypothetical protein